MHGVMIDSGVSVSFIPCRCCRRQMNLNLHLTTRFLLLCLRDRAHFLQY